MLFVQHNLLAENANRQLNVSTKKNAKTTEKLSSGYKINRAADDAAGLSISEKMRRQVRGLHQTVSNISEGTGYVQTAEGALNEVHDMLQRMNELAVKSANGTNTEEDRAYIDREVQQLKAEMDRIFETTTFNEQRIWEPRERKLIGTVPKQAVEFTYAYESIAVTNDNCGVVAYGDYTINASEKDGIYINWTGYDGKLYKTTPITWEELKEKKFSFDMADYFGEKTADNNKKAIQCVSTMRSEYGAVQNRLEHTGTNLDNIVENTQAAESAIRDTDIADTMLEYSVNNILAQAGTSMLTRANQSKQLALELLG